MFFSLVAFVSHENILTTKISRSTVYNYINYVNVSEASSSSKTSALVSIYTYNIVSGFHLGGGAFAPP